VLVNKIEVLRPGMQKIVNYGRFQSTDSTPSQFFILEPYRAFDLAIVLCYIQPLIRM